MAEHSLLNTDAGPEASMSDPRHCYHGHDKGEASSEKKLAQDGTL